MEAKWIGITAVAPIAWGANYVVTRQLLPADVPLWGSVWRALPAALVLLAVARALPSGHWWWRSAVLGILNIGAFFGLIYLAAQLLPSSVAASLMALSPIVMAGFAWLLVAERPTARVLLGSLAGIIGVLAVVGGATGQIDAGGVLASIAAMLLSGVGYVLTKRWSDGTSLVAITAWQLAWGGLLLTGLALAMEGAPPALSGTEVTGFAFTSIVATAIAYLCWFAGLDRLRATTVGVVGLLNPVTGVVLGAAVAHEDFSLLQVAGTLLVLGGIFLASRTREAEPAPELLRSPSRETPALAGVR